MEEKKKTRKKRSRRRGRRRKKQPDFLEKQETWPADDVGLTILRFSACTQCGYFLTSYRAALGFQSLENAVAQSEHNWLDLGWHEAMPKLLHHAYELVTDGTPTFLEHCCPECHRIISIQDVEIEQEGKTAATTNLAIQIMPD